MEWKLRLSSRSLNLFLGQNEEPLIMPAMAVLFEKEEYEPIKPLLVMLGSLDWTVSSLLVLWRAGPGGQRPKCRETFHKNLLTLYNIFQKPGEWNYPHLILGNKSQHLSSFFVDFRPSLPDERD